MADKTTGELLQDALNAGVRATLGDLKFELIALQAENGVLKARVAALEAAKADRDVKQAVVFDAAAQASQSAEGIL